MTNTTQHQPQWRYEYPARPESERLRIGALVVGILTTGLVAGIFVDWSSAVMPGLSEVDDRAFVQAFQALDAAITNPLFLGMFMGAVPLLGVTAALHLRADQRPVLLWIGAALVCYIVACAITFGVHEPLNQALRDVGALESDADFAAARELVEEARWTAWNTVRAVATTLACGCLVGALAVRRRRS